MQIMWYGKEGPQGRFGVKDSGFLSIPVEPEIGVRAGRVLRLLPGINDDVNPEDWKVAATYPLIKYYLKEGYLEVIDTISLGKLVPAEARKMVEATIDRTLLARWRKEDLTTKAPEVTRERPGR